MKHVFHVRLSRLWLGAACWLLTANSVWAQLPLTNQPANPAPGTTRPTLTHARVAAGKLYFQATSLVGTNAELAVTDGTAAGTSLLRSITPVPRQVLDPRGFTEFNGLVYFSANDGINGRELWVTDGTNAGTRLVRNIRPGVDNSDPGQFAVVNGKLYFVASSTGFSADLWVSDGTSAGTQRLTDALGIPTGGAVQGIVAAGNKLFYDTQSNDLWVTDGTAAGTRFLKGGPLIPAVPDGPRYFASISQLTNYDGLLLFRGNVISTFEDEPWFSDGTPEGTHVIDIVPGALGSFPAPPFVYFNGLMFFVTGLPTPTLRATDGTLAGTRTIKVGYAKNMTQFNGKLYFTINGVNLWSTDGTEAGTQLILTGSISDLFVSNNKLYLLTTPTFPSTGHILQESDGTTAGTKVVPVQTTLFGRTINAVNLNDNVIFTSGNDFSSDVQLFKLTPPAPPTVVSFPDRTGTVGVYYFQSIAAIVPSSGPVSYKMEGLPPGLAFSGGSGGLIGGIPTTAGVYSITYSVANMFGITIGISYFNFVINAAGGGSAAFALSAPLYNCATGGFTLQTGGGNGSLIDYQIPGITDWTANPSGTIPTHIRQDANSMPLLLRARQGSNVVSMTFNFVTACSGSGGGALQVLAPTYNCSTGAITFNTSGGNGSPITFSAPGIQRASATSNTGIVEPGLRFDPKPILITAMQSGVSVGYTFNPICGGARQASDGGNDLVVRVMGNPTTSDQVEVEVSGAAGRSMRLSLIDTQGRLLSEETIEQPAPTERRTLRLASNAGVYLLQVGTPTQSRTVKIIR
ncbi:MAG: T9SS C-terminal target domain-containing protein [Cytophagales bacterium]|nr:MAG: T9SS C-terminal target domain-containing protein [Cytophagales bacterium]